MENPAKDIHGDLSGEIGVFIDRDGTINKADRGEYITNWPEFEFIPGALEAIAILAELPVKIFVVTNQSAVHRDMITKSDLEMIHSLMEFEIVSAGGRIDGLKYCPHTPKEKCDCRKPKNLLFVELSKEHAIDLDRSFNIGDTIRDMQAGEESGTTNILVRTGHGKMSDMELKNNDVKVDYIVDNILDAAKVVMQVINEKSKS